MVSNVLQITNSGSEYYGSDGEKYSLEAFDGLIKDGTPFVVLRKGDGKNITSRVIDRVKRKVWQESELELIRQHFGKETLKSLSARLSNKSEGQIRHMADKLKLTRDKSWTDREVSALAALRKSGVPSETIGEILGRPRRAVEVKISKMGLSQGAVSGGRSAESIDYVEAEGAPFANLDAITKGKIAEDFASISLMKHGLDVFLPYQPNHKTDLVVVGGDKVCKLQVKSAIWEKGTGRFRVPLVRKNPRSHKRIHYDTQDVDFFILVCLGVNATYVVPYNQVLEKREAHLYPHRPKKSQGEFDWEVFREAFSLIKDWF